MADILLIEDEDVLRRNLGFILNSAGWFTIAARSGTEAMEILKKRRFDLVITDLVMPGKSGEEIVNHIAGNHPGTKVIIITAYPTAESAICAIKRGVADYFTKPFRTEDILETVKKVLEKSGGASLNWSRLGPFRITRKEEALLRLVIEENVTKIGELAGKLSVKNSTAKQHLQNLYAKFSVKNKAALISAVLKALTTD